MMIAQSLDSSSSSSSRCSLCSRRSSPSSSSSEKEKKANAIFASSSSSSSSSSLETEERTPSRGVSFFLSFFLSFFISFFERGRKKCRLFLLSFPKSAQKAKHFDPRIVSFLSLFNRPSHRSSCAPSGTPRSRSRGDDALTGCHPGEHNAKAWKGRIGEEVGAHFVTSRARDDHRKRAIEGKRRDASRCRRPRGLEEVIASSTSSTATKTYRSMTRSSLKRDSYEINTNGKKKRKPSKRRTYADRRRCFTSSAQSCLWCDVSSRPTPRMETSF